MTAGPAYGWTGKLPAYGDFLTGGAYSPFLAGIRDWLADGMAAARADGLNLDAFLTTPLVRLVASPRAFGGAGGLAVFGPGMDAVGRAFPFAVVVEASGAAICKRMIDAPVFDEMEDGFLSALDPKTGQAGLAALQPPEIPVIEDSEEIVCLAEIGDNGGLRRFESPLEPQDFGTLFESAPVCGAAVG